MLRSGDQLWDCVVTTWRGTGGEGVEANNPHRELKTYFEFEMFDAVSTAAGPPQDPEPRRPGDAHTSMLLR